jgi:LysR family transcriptional regulator, transcriptional activator of the cysJI operon
MGRVPFTLEQLRTFLAVANQGSMSAASRSLFLTQGAVSQQVASLEAALGLRLLDRSGGRSRLTEAGRSIATSCEAAMRAVDGVAERARQLTTLEVGSLHIGASPTPAAHYLPRLLSLFIRLHPNVHVRVVTENNPAVAAKVAGGILDCAIVEAETGIPDLLEHRLVEDEVVLVAAPAHPLTREREIGIAQLARHRYLGREPGAALEIVAADLLGAAYDSIPKMEFGRLDAVRGAALAGLGYALLPRVAIDREVAEGRLVELAIPPRRRWISLIRRPSVGAIALEEFWRLAVGSPPAVGGSA